MSFLQRLRAWVRRQPVIEGQDIDDKAEIERTIVRLEERLLLAQRRLELRNR